MSGKHQEFNELIETFEYIAILIKELITLA